MAKMVFKKKAVSNKKRITFMTYLYSIFNKEEKLQVDEKIYNKFIVNRYISEIDDFKYIDFVNDNFNDMALEKMSAEMHYEILFNKIPKGFYKLDKHSMHTIFKDYSKLKKAKNHFTKKRMLKISDYNYCLSLLSTGERSKERQFLQDVTDELKWGLLCHKII